MSDNTRLPVLPSNIFHISQEVGEKLDRYALEEEEGGPVTEFMGLFGLLKEKLVDSVSDKEDSPDEGALGNDVVFAYMENPHTYAYNADTSVISYRDQQHYTDTSVPGPTLNVHNAVVALLLIMAEAQLLEAKDISEDLKDARDDLQNARDKYRKIRDDLIEKQREAENAGDSKNPLKSLFSGIGKLIGGGAAYLFDPDTGKKLIDDGIDDLEHFGEVAWGFIKNTLEGLGHLATGDWRKANSHFALASAYLLDFIPLEVLLGELGRPFDTDLQGLDIIKHLQDYYVASAWQAQTSEEDRTEFYEENKELMNRESFHAIQAEYYAGQIRGHAKLYDAEQTGINTRITVLNQRFSEKLENLKNIQDMAVDIIKQYHESSALVARNIAA